MGIERATAFHAQGQAFAGFRTTGSRIERGVDVDGTEFGVRCAGPTGIKASGVDCGVYGIGTEGAGKHGRGGRFQSADHRAQVQLINQMQPGNRWTTQAAKPEELANAAHVLPEEGQAGDLYMSGFEGYGGVLWLCVWNSSPGKGAKWCQLLLGAPVVGERPL
jgi:hypothetical protein